MCALDAYLEKVWGGILSEEEQLIIETFQELGNEDQQTILAHLKKMVSEDGWQPSQVHSASKALAVLDQGL
ncbi:MAG: hypothetical protein JEZ00_16310 [Anaerolineaceae bacterium]|nr:hypothetical protein [Anaerolineaceae bacterium]